MCNLENVQKSLHILGLSSKMITDLRNIYQNQDNINFFVTITIFTTDCMYDTYLTRTNCTESRKNNIKNCCNQEKQNDTLANRRSMKNWCMVQWHNKHL